MATARTGTGSSRTTAQTGALIFGVVYLLVGILGFLLVRDVGFLENNPDAKLLGIFAVNQLHNLIHLLVGIAGIAMSRKHETARQFGLALAVVYGLVFLYGLLSELAFPSEALLNNNWADVGLHLISAAAAYFIYKSGDNRATARS